MFERKKESPGGQKEGDDQMLSANTHTHTRARAHTHTRAHNPIPSQVKQSSGRERADGHTQGQENKKDIAFRLV